MKKIIFGVVVVMALIAGIFVATSIDRKSKNNSKKVTIITTLFPLYDFAKNVGQDKVEVSLLLPPGTEPHTFEPKPSDIAKISSADVFIYTGKFMEPWAEDVLKGVSNNSLKVVDASAGIKMISGVFSDADKPAGSLDPHIWLNFDNDQKMVQVVADSLAEKDRANAKYYQQKASEYKNKFLALDAKYESSLSKCQSKKIVYGGHYAFGYLAERYGLEYLAAQGISPDSEPTAQDLVRLVEQIKKDDIKYVFYEELTTSKIAETLASETKAQMLLLNAAHNLTKKDFEKQISFISIMEQNLVNLKIGLECNK
jgi:zinc transport system substrate-binding protein